MRVDANREFTAALWPKIMAIHIRYSLSGHISRFTKSSSGNLAKQQFFCLEYFSAISLGGRAAVLS